MNPPRPQPAVPTEAIHYQPRGSKEKYTACGLKIGRALRKRTSSNAARTTCGVCRTTDTYKAQVMEDALNPSPFAKIREQRKQRMREYDRQAHQIAEELEELDDRD